MRKYLTERLAAAGLLVGVSLFVIAAPSGATTVSDEAGLRASFADVAESEILLADDITLEDCESGDLDRNSTTDLALDGNGFTITQTCPGERVMAQGGTGELALANVTITGGNLSAGNGGGGVWAFGGGPVTLTNATVTGNSAPTTGGGGINGTDVTLIDSTVSNNSAADFGGAMNVQNATLINSTVNGNTSAGRAGGIAADTITMTNSTVSGNTATTGGPTPFSGGGGLYANSVTLVYSTVAGNAAPARANVFADAGIASFGSVVALPQGGGGNCGGAGTTTSHGFNASDDASCGFTHADDLATGSPGLGGLADNGGLTQTRLPAPGSRLVDAIPAASCEADGASGVKTDQRDIDRPQGSGCDIGAVEVAGDSGLAGCPATPTPNQRFICNLFLDVLGRPAEVAGREFWAVKLDTGTPRATVTGQIVNSAEARRAWVDRVYSQYLGRPADATGLSLWSARVGTVGPRAVRKALLSSGEYFTKVGGTNTAFANAMYADVLRQAPVPAGVTQIVNQLGSGTPRGTVADQQLGSVRGRTMVVGDLYTRYLRRNPTTAEANAGAAVTGANAEFRVETTILTTAEYYAR